MPLLAICWFNFLIMSRLKNFFSKRIRSFGYAFKGIWWFFSSQVNARIHLLAVVLLVALGTWMHISATEWAILFVCMGIVITTEALNTAIEWIIDLVSPEYHPLAGKVKDVSAGAVLLSVLFCAAAWAFIFIPKFASMWL